MSSLLLALRPFDRDNAYTKQKIMPAARAIKMLEMYLRGCDIGPPARTVLTWSIVSMQQVK